MASGPAPRRPAIDRALARVTRPTDVAALVAFRVAVGLIVTVSATRFLAYGWVDELFYKPTFFFKYWGLSWVRPLPAPLMHVAFVALAALGLCVAAGLFYRAAAGLVCALVLWVQLIDVTNYLNHYYLLGLLTGLMALMPLGRAVSLDAWRRPDTRVSHFPVWCTYLLRVQVAVVYVHAGLAKATPDWLLHAQPLNIWLSARTDTPLVGALFDERAMAYAMSWGGFFFDTTIALFLAWRRTRVFAYVVVLAFHATVGRLFPIGMFPWIMIAAVLVFFEPTWPRDVIAKLRALRARSGVRQVLRARVVVAARRARRAASTRRSPRRRALASRRASRSRSRRRSACSKRSRRCAATSTAATCCGTSRACAGRGGSWRARRTAASPTGSTRPRRAGRGPSRRGPTSPTVSCASSTTSPTSSCSWLTTSARSSAPRGTATCAYASTRS